MMLPRFEYHAPSTLAEACELMAGFGEKGSPLAGGTDLIVNMRKGILSPENVVSLSRIDELKEMSSHRELRLGACMPVSEVGQSKEVADVIQSLIVAANGLGSPLIRNLATIGGNIVTARPAADLPPPLMAYGARVTLKSSTRERTVPLDEFFLGPGQTVRSPDEILTSVVMEKSPPLSGGAYLKLGRRKALVISLVNVAAFLSLEDRNGPIQKARVVLGAVAPVPMRSPSAEKVLMGERPSKELFKKASEAAGTECRPIDDFRGSAEYRRAMVAVLTRRALHMALENALKK